MKTVTFSIFIFLFFVAIAAAKPRVLVLTDIGEDPDDAQSMIRFLLHSNEFDILGLIATKESDEGGATYPRDDIIRELVDKYGLVRDNLAKHAQGYPTVEYLKQVTRADKYGQDLGEGQNTEGSQLIFSVVDTSSQPVWVLVWGGPRPLSQALWQVQQERSAAEFQHFKAKLRLYFINFQDQTADWILTNCPDLWAIVGQGDGNFRSETYRGMFLLGDYSITSKEWLNEHVRTNHGPLGEAYPFAPSTSPNPHSAVKEGDTPSFLHLLCSLRYLSDAAQPEWGGWGGRHIPLPDYGPNWYSDRFLSGDFWQGSTDRRLSVARWRQDFQNEFAARMDWCVKDFAEANHAPRAKINGETITKIFMAKGRPGQQLELDAAGSFDPDGDALSYRWWIYPEPTTYKGSLQIQKAESQKAFIKIPQDFENSLVHIILEVKDDGEPSLVSYGRIVIIGEKYEYYLKKTLNDIKIDGKKDEAWFFAQLKNIEKPAGIEAPLSDLSGQWRAMWDTDFLYMFIEMQDGAPTLQKSMGLEHDAVHIFIDSEPELQNSETHFHYYISKLSSYIEEQIQQAVTGVDKKMVLSDSGYVVELKIPWTTIKKNTNNETFFLEIRALDYRDRFATLPDAAVAWYSAGQVDPFETGLLGVVYLGSEEMSPDNLSPLVDVTHPAPNASFNFGNPVDILVDASDVDGTVNRVDFYDAAIKIGSDRDNLDGWSLRWENALPGNHDLHVVATDDGGATTSSINTRIVVFQPDAESVLLVIGEELLPGDVAVQQRLEQQFGYKVVKIDDDVVNENDAENKVLLYLSESIAQNKIENFFADSIVPIICADPDLFAGLKMTGSATSADFGLTDRQYDTVSILQPGHELAAGFAGTPKIFSNPETLIWGKPSDQAQNIAAVADDPDQIVYFAYERKAEMVGLSAPSSRIGFFVSTKAVEQLNENGWALFDAAVRWAIERHITHIQVQNIPIDFITISSYPNPFNPETIFSIYLPKTDKVSIDIYDIRGRLVKNLTSEMFESGQHTITWDATDRDGVKVASSVYVAKFSVGKEIYFYKITLVK